MDLIERNSSKNLMYPFFNFIQSFSKVIVSSYNFSQTKNFRYGYCYVFFTSTQNKTLFFKSPIHIKKCIAHNSIEIDTILNTRHTKANGKLINQTI